MFTKATQEYGNWRPDHISKRGSPTMESLSLLVAFGACAFVCWLIFFISLKIRSEFYVLENNGIKLHSVSALSGLSIDARPAALRVGIVQGKTNDLLVLFENGDVLSFPSQKELIAKNIRKRFDEMVLTGLLTLIANPSISRIQLWPDQGAAESKVELFVNFLIELGFDDFDIAFEAKNAK